MSDALFERLSGLDRSFLIYEGPCSPMHVAAVEIFEGGPLRGADGAIDAERMLEYVASRLHRIPRYRQCVVPAPLGGYPIWVDDAHFNLRYHVRHTRLPRPGSERLLKRACARILEQRLDLHKPLWELWLVEGLEGDRVAMISKTHHCMIDGIGGVDLLSVLLTPEPLEKIEPPPLWMPLPAPGVLDYALAEAGRSLSAPLRAAGAVLRVVRDEGHSRHELAERLRAVGRLGLSTVSGSTPTPINQPIGPHRRFDWLVTSLDDMSAVRKHLGGTVNDVILATTAGALRRFLGEQRGTELEGLHFKVMAPVSIRQADEHGQFGNRVAAWFVPLPLAERDPLRRYAQVRATTERLKRRHEALGAETLTQAMGWLGATPIALGARLFQGGQPPFNMVVTNVPGPRQPLYLLGARMLEAHPMVPLFGRLGVGIALFSYLRRISWGFCADWDLVPDLHDLVRDVELSLAELCDAAARVGAAPPPRGASAPHGDAKPTITRRATPRKAS